LDVRPEEDWKELKGRAVVDDTDLQLEFDFDNE
jgi:hypothetical protein